MAYGLVRDGKLFRVTFSLSLAEYLARLTDERYEVVSLTFRVGRRLEPGEESRSGLYALCSKKTGTVLRISLLQEIAEEMLDPAWRYLAECYL